MCFGSSGRVLVLAAASACFAASHQIIPVTQPSPICSVKKKILGKSVGLLRDFPATERRDILPFLFAAECLMT
jgi:hypothetical protein